MQFYTTEYVAGMLVKKNLGMVMATLENASRQSRQMVLEALGEKAEDMGANAVVGVRFDSGGAEITAYGTALNLIPRDVEFGR